MVRPFVSTTNRTLLCVALLTAAAPVRVRADFGDYVDPTFDCPATTTCPQVCVRTVDECPTAMLCEYSNETLCEDDGVCVVSGDQECAEVEEYACEFECAPVACRKIVDTYDQCLSKYQPLYDYEAQCGEEEIAYETDYLTFTETGYIVGYVWVSTVTVLILVWCAYNQKIRPIVDSTTSLQIDAEVTGSQGGVMCTQTGYKWTLIGAFLYFCTIITWAGFIATLAWLTIQYYVWWEQPQLENRTLHFEDENQLLMTFVIVWSVGFVFSFCLKYPYSISSLFLRRCVLSEATHVAVFLDQENTEDEPTLNNSIVGYLMAAFEWAFHYVGVLMAFIFSDTSRYMRQRGIFKYCKVKREPDGTRSFIFLLRRYNLDSEHSGVFVPGSWSVGGTLSDLKAKAKTSGLSANEVQERYRSIGRNVIEMEKPSYLKSLGEEFSKPFYTYQLYIVWTWFPLYYYYMAMIIGFTVCLSGFTVAFFHYRNLRSLYKITRISGEAQVIRDDEVVTVDQKNLVPGDLIKLAPGVTYCDMVILSGGDTLVDESALTGEATPQVKTPIDATDGDRKFSLKADARHAISAGTTILEAEDSLGLVMKTSSYTVKGELLREIFAFRRHKFKFDKEVYIVIGILIVYALIGFGLVLYLVNEPAEVGWFYGMYVVASAIPPLLPTTFTVSVGVSDARLSAKRIACANSQSILVAGKVTKAFFDKTGTLTKQGLDFASVKCGKDWETKEITEDMATAMACCHSIALTSNGVTIGNPVDRTMFAVSGATLESTGSTTVVVARNAKKVEVVRHFDFDHQRMTQGVIAKLPGGEFVAFVKGSGESISKICLAESLPEDFASSLSESAAAGMYQISVAFKPIPSESVGTITREEVEKDLEFLGVLNFLNALREDTPDVIHQLANGNVQSIMLTGDHTLTGIRVGRKAGILSPDKRTVVGVVDHDSMDIAWSDQDGEVDMPTAEELESGMIELALNGKAWVQLRRDSPKLAKSVVPFLRVVGRCTPHDKVSVVDTFVELGFITLMCGDGGNDCGALKAAHVGVALSDAEASIVAPFTSLDRTISSVVEILKEGRCALASALAVYKYIIMYGQITTFNQIMTAYFELTFGEWCWVFIDGVWPILMAYSLPLARAAKTLAKTRPTASILGAHTVSSAVGVLLLHLTFASVALVVLHQQDWYQCRKWGEADLSSALGLGDNYESTVIWLVTGYQYISTAMAYNFGYEFRQGWLRNYVFVVLVVALSVIHFYIIFNPGKLSCFFRINCTNDNVVIGVTGSGWLMPIQNPFNTTVMPRDFQWYMFAIIIGNTIAVMAYDYFVVNGIRRKRAAAKLKAIEEGQVQHRGSLVGARRASVFQPGTAAEAERSEVWEKAPDLVEAVEVSEAEGEDSRHTSEYDC